MKTKVAFLFSAALLAGTLLSAPAVFAQSSPPPHPDFAAMRANMQQLDALRKTERSQILGSLSSAHRQYLASVVGQLAIAANPDPRAAAAALDAHLSPSERTAILNADSSFQTQMRALRDKMRAQRPQDGTAGGPPGGPPGAPGMGWKGHDHGQTHHTPDAGRILLKVASLGGSHHMMGHP